jgi:HlyD family secretion protein
MKRLLYIVIAIAILGGGGYAYLKYRQQQQNSALNNYQTEEAHLGSLTSTIGATGQVRSKQTATLDWKTSGTVEQVYFAVGDQVRAGEKLAELAKTSLPQNIILAEADLESAQKALDDLYTSAEISRVQALQSISEYAKSVKDAQYQLDNFSVPDEQAKLAPIDAWDLMKKKLDAARAAFEPYKYYPSSDSTREDLKDKLDSAQADFNVAVKRLEYDYALQVATANLEKARQDYERWKNGPQPSEITAAQARIDAAQATLSQAWIEAPLTGIITFAQPQVGDQVSPNTPAFRLDDMNVLLVDVPVSEIDINQVESGQQVSLSFDAIRARQYKGEVVAVDRVGTSDQGVVDFTVTVRLIDPDQAVKPGMTAAVNIVVNQLENTLLVPNRAVRFKDGKQVVYILKDNQVSPVNIELGASSDSDSQVIDGDLKVGDQIVLNPPADFGDQNGPPPFVRGRGQ